MVWIAQMQFDAVVLPSKFELVWSGISFDMQFLTFYSSLHAQFQSFLTESNWIQFTIYWVAIFWIFIENRQPPIDSPWNMCMISFDFRNTSTSFILKMSFLSFEIFRIHLVKSVSANFDFNKMLYFIKNLFKYLSEIQLN